MCSRLPFRQKKNIVLEVLGYAICSEVSIPQRFRIQGGYRKPDGRTDRGEQFSFFVCIAK